MKERHSETDRQTDCQPFKGLIKSTPLSAVSQACDSAGHNDETTEKSLFCSNEGNMIVNAGCRFIWVMRLLFWFHLDFTCGYNLIHTPVSLFTLKENKPFLQSAIVNGLSTDTNSKVWPGNSLFPNTLMCAGQILGLMHCALIATDHTSGSTFSDSNCAKGNSRHISNCDVLTHHQFHFGFTVP